MLNVDDTLDAENVLKIFDELEVQNSPFKSRYRGDDFSSKFHCRRVADDEFPACVTCHGLLHLRTMSKQINS